jgi:NAD(P)-dependent dehydrogenase (short-subunit alcohol dehydrogenase family)
MSAVDRPEPHPSQTFDPPGVEAEMDEQPRDAMADYGGSGLLEGCTALVTGADSGIGRAVAVAFAKEGADVVGGYLDEHVDAARTGELVAAQGRRFVPVAGDVSEEQCRDALLAAVADLGGHLDVLVNNAATQAPVEKVEALHPDQWRRTFAVNLEAAFFLTQGALRLLGRGSAVVNTASVTGLQGHASLIDYAATKGGMIALTFSLAQALLPRGIRVNAVAPGPVWTPLIPATMPAEQVESFGAGTPYGRAAEPDEIAPSYVFFASPRMSSYYTGEVLAPVGGQILPA